MNNNIKVTVPLSCQKELEKPAIQEEIRQVQEYLNATQLEMDKSTLYFVPLKGVYTHINRKMLMAGILINKQEKEISALKATLRLKTDHPQMEAAAMHLAFPPQFLGTLKPNEGMLVHLNIPVKNLTEDQSFAAFQLQSQMENIQVVFSENENCSG